MLHFSDRKRKNYLSFLLSTDMAFSNIKVNCKLTLKRGDSKITYQIVSPDQVSPVDHKISLNSPIVQELIKNQSNKVTIRTPMGEVEYEVLEVSEA